MDEPSAARVGIDQGVAANSATSHVPRRAGGLERSHYVIFDLL
jgi:hypothetical protein